MYVGKAKKLEKRWGEHRSNLNYNSHKNIHLQRAWNEYGEDKFLFEVLVECEEEHLFSEEHYWCNILLVHNDKYGYNIRPTNPTDTAGHAEETRKKLSEINTGKVRTAESKKRQSIARMGMRPSQETIEKCRIAHTGVTFSENVKRKLSESAKNRVITQAIIDGIQKRKRTIQNKYGAQNIWAKGSSGRSRAIIQTDKDGIVKEWSSMTEIQKFYNITATVVYRLLKNETVRNKGRNNYLFEYKWEYKN